MPYLTSKTIGGASGFSCCFRDHNDEESSLGFLHGAVLSFKLMFEADNQEDLKLVSKIMDDLDEFLETNFGHTTIVAQDDPSMEAFDQLDEDNAIDLVVLPATSIEAFAKAVFDYCDHLVQKEALSTLTVHSVECREHEGSAAIYARDDTVIELTQDDKDDTPS